MELSLVAGLCRDTLARSYPDEADEVDAALIRLRAGERRPRPPVAMGVELLPLADHLLPALVFLSGAVAGRGAERVADAVADRAVAALDRWLGGKKTPPPAPEEEEAIVAALRDRLDSVTPEEAARLGEALIAVLRDPGR